MDLQRKYLTLEEFRKIAPQQTVFFNCPDGPPTKGTKAHRRAVSYFKHSMLSLENLVQLDLQLDEHHETVQHYIDQRESKFVNLAQSRIYVEPVASIKDANGASSTADSFHRKLPLHTSKKTLITRLTANNPGQQVVYCQDERNFVNNQSSTYKPVMYGQGSQRPGPPPPQPAYKTSHYVFQAPPQGIPPSINPQAHRVKMQQ